VAERAEKKAAVNNRWKIEENNVNWMTGREITPLSL
jgi:hypothetical protein